MVVDQVKFLGALKRRRDVKAFPDLGVNGRIFRVWLRANRNKMSRGDRISRGKERNVDTPLNQSLREKRDNLLPGSVVSWWYAPGNRRQHCNSHGAEPFSLNFPRAASAAKGRAPPGGVPSLVVHVWGVSGRHRSRLFLRNLRDHGLCCKHQGSNRRCVLYRGPGHLRGVYNA